MTLTVAVIGPLGAGKTFLATSLALYLHLASARAVFIDAADKTGARLLKGVVPLAADVSEAREMKAKYAVVDTSIFDTPKADKYVAVLEPADLRHVDVESLERRGYYIVVNKAGALSAWARGWIPFVREVAWSYQRGVHPLLCGSPPLERFRRRIGKILRQIAQWL